LWKASHRPAAAQRSGISLIEVSLSSLLTGILLLAALQAVGQSALSQNSTALRAQGDALAQGLLAEILARAYRDPDGSVTLGLDAGEALPRTNYDDVDDYGGYTEAALMSRAGATLSDPGGWQRLVQVEWVDAATATSVSGVETGAKRITVIATYKNTERGRAIGVRCNAP
jgi:Tfp pilus assembly protein PilV